MYIVAIIAAAGQGRRFGSAVPKQLVRVGGRTLLERSVDAFAGSPRVDEIIIAAPPQAADGLAASLEARGKPLKVVRGGERRQDSVANAFEAVPPHADLVVIHDAARAFVTLDLIERTLEAAAAAGAAIAAMPSRDTVKQVSVGPDGARLVAGTLARDQIYLAQTPQAFRRAVLADAIALGRTGVEATDEAMLAERAGHPVRIVESDASNLKVTTPEDLTGVPANAEAGEDTRTMRTGIGYDLHRLVEGRPLILGGVTIPFERGPHGHSDGDAICHALTDAVLGAVAAGDIGRHFPDTDPRWKGADSLTMLRAAVSMAGERGYLVAQVDVVVILERPRLAPHIEAIRAALAGSLGVDITAVSVKGKTNEGVDAVGRGEAVAVHAIAVLRARGEPR
jgi:2-C-methyl-D-erythritol 4-phosphate cytidylyltransferase / 2-C-methyl-D-erythritol 2,4-cyclodiphosphate synthase